MSKGKLFGDGLDLASGQPIGDCPISALSRLLAPFQSSKNDSKPRSTTLIPPHPSFGIMDLDNDGDGLGVTATPETDREVVRLWRAWRTVNEMCSDRVRALILN